MLKIRIHAGSLDTLSSFNQLAWLDVAYEKLAALADYKVVLFQTGIGATEPRVIADFPRWSASLWALAARALALALHPDDDNPLEEVVVRPAHRKSCAFTKEMCAVIEHSSGPRSNKCDTLGTVSISQIGRLRGHYHAQFEEHAGSACRTEPFAYAPDYFFPAELLLHACLARFSEQLVLPPRPALCVPLPVVKDGRRYVPIHRLVEPARTGFQNWLRQFSEPALPEEGAPLGLAPEPLYAKFLQEAI